MVIFKENLLCIPISKRKGIHEKGNISVNFFDEDGTIASTFPASTLEDAECFAIAHIKAGITNEATVIGFSQEKIIMYSMFKKEEH